MLKGPEERYHGRKLVIENTENENESQLARQMKREKWKNKSFGFFFKDNERGKDSSNKKQSLQ